MNQPTLEIIFGLFAPFIISFLKNPQWNTQAKVALSVGISLLLAIGTELYAKGTGMTWDVPSILTATAAVFATSNIFYKTIIAETGLNASLEAKKVL